MSSLLSVYNYVAFYWTMQIEEHKKKLKVLAERSFAEMVKKQREEIKSLEQIKKRYNECLKEHDDTMNGVKLELSKVDKAIRELRPSLRLDSFEERCKCVNGVSECVANCGEEIQALSHRQP